MRAVIGDRCERRSRRSRRGNERGGRGAACNIGLFVISHSAGKGCQVGTVATQQEEKVLARVEEGRVASKRIGKRGDGARKRVPSARV
jgi:hypothetical protein